MIKRAHSQPPSVHKTCDIAVVGGGMVGASLAAMLCAVRNDWQIALVEAFDINRGSDSSAKEVIDEYQSSFDARSSALSIGSVDYLRNAGLWEQLSQHLTPIRQVHVSDKGHFGGTLIDAKERSVPALGYVLENAWLGKVLMAHLSRQTNLSLYSPAEVRALKPVAEGQELQLVSKGRIEEDFAEGNCEENQEQTLHCQLAIVADGTDSPLRQSLGIDLNTREYNQVAIIANVEHQRPHKLVAYERFTSQGPLALLPLGETADSRRSALVWTQPEFEVEQVVSLAESKQLSLLQSQFGYRLGHFRKLGQQHVYPLKLTVAKEQVRRGLVVMGNAAHCLHPVAGQGFNLALRDCAALVEVLAQAMCGEQQNNNALGDVSVLQTYLTRQQRDQDITIGLSDQIVRWFSTDRLPEVVLRNLGFFSLELMPLAKRCFAQQTMGLAGPKALLFPSSKREVVQR